MTDTGATLLLEAAVATTLALLIIGLLRRVGRRVVGAQAAYLFWLLVPASLIGILLPQPEPSIAVAHSVIAESAASVARVAFETLPIRTAPVEYTRVAALIWLSGCLLRFLQLAIRQRAFVRALGTLQRSNDGVYRSASVFEPMLIGVWRPRIVIPRDFEMRYMPEERAPILAHELAHIERHDALAIAAATGISCIFWFNPLVYWALNWFRFDQELACDASVLSTSEFKPRQYAQALLKTQLVADSPGAFIGCGWRSDHPLKERIMMLNQPLPRARKRLAGKGLAIVLMVTGGYVAWAAQSNSLQTINHAQSPIAISLKWTIDTTDALYMVSGNRHPDIGLALMTRLPGQVFVLEMDSPPLMLYPAGMHYRVRCAASTPNRALTLSDTFATDRDAILVACQVRSKGGSEWKILAKPVVLLQDGKWGSAEVTDALLRVSLRIEINASMSPTRIRDAERGVGYFR